MKLKILILVGLAAFCIGIFAGAYCAGRRNTEAAEAESHQQDDLCLAAMAGYNYGILKKSDAQLVHDLKLQFPQASMWHTN
jgi:hypothetical protein